MQARTLQNFTTSKTYYKVTETSNSYSNCKQKVGVKCDKAEIKNEGVIKLNTEADRYKCKRTKSLRLKPL